jgi:hypothetical protein
MKAGSPIDILAAPVSKLNSTGEALVVRISLARQQPAAYRKKNNMGYCMHLWVIMHQRRMRLNYITNSSIEHQLNPGLEHQLNPGLEHQLNSGLEHQLYSGLEHQLNPGMEYQGNLGIEHQLNSSMEIDENNLSRIFRKDNQEHYLSYRRELGNKKQLPLYLLLAPSTIQWNEDARASKTKSLISLPCPRLRNSAMPFYQANTSPSIRQSKLMPSLRSVECEMR